MATIKNGINKTFPEIVLIGTNNIILCYFNTTILYMFIKTKTKLKECSIVFYYKLYHMI